MIEHRPRRSAKPHASLSLDLDNQWAYLKTHGSSAWETRPSYLPQVVPTALEMLEQAGLHITFFVVGHDAAAEPSLVGALADAGHEIGNHSWSHEPWLHLYDEDEIAVELDRTADAIEAATGRRPSSFRGPGYSLSEPLVRMLHDRGYAVDASTLPTWIGPLARRYYFRSTQLSPAERDQRAALFGSWADALRPIAPYRWRLPQGTLLELPVTTFPLLRVPMHVSYVIYLELVAPVLARTYFRAALAACRAAKVEPSILLHPLDLLGGDELRHSGLEFFPGMALSGARKRRLVLDCLRLLADRFDVVPVGEHAAALDARSRPLAERSPRSLASTT
jgi:peptidoglycan/xylan/chitin deacetylase (PgdA/CDA1 family)